jgi:hypothetical protein
MIGENDVPFIPVERGDQTFSGVDAIVHGLEAAALKGVHEEEGIGG